MSTPHPKYPSYRKTEAEWLGNVPSDWETLPIGRLFNRVKRTGFPQEQLLSVYRDYGVVVKSSRDDNFNKPSDDLSPYQLVQIEDLVMNKMKAWQGSVAISKLSGIVSPAYFVYEPYPHQKRKYRPKFVHYLLRSPRYVTQYYARSKGIRVNQWDLDPHEFERIETLLPPLEEQTQIAKFLDYETAKIDALIEKQQQLIALLKEKRQAVITQAATKGVRCDACFRNSGIGWMGKIPSHWKVLPVKRLFEVSYGIMGEINRALETGTRVISLPNVSKDGSLDLGTVSFRRLSESEKQTALLKKGDLLFNWRNGSVDHVGKTALFNAPGEYAHVSFLLKLRALSDDVLPHFYWLALNGLRASGFFGTSKLQVNVTYNQTELRRVLLPVPPANEQREIIDRVLGAYRSLDATCQKAEKLLEVLSERRTALISAAVTGKIDVRNWKPLETNTEQSS